MKYISKKQLEDITLAGLCITAGKMYKNRPAFAIFNDGKLSKQITYGQLENRSQQIAAILKQYGIEKGNKVLLFSENNPDWPVAYFGIALTGAVSVPLLTGFSGEQVQNIINHSGVSAVCISSVMKEKYEQMTALPEFQKIPVICIDKIPENQVQYTNEKIENNFSEAQFLVFQKPDDLATIIYTSGTQGNSKGVMLSSKNIISSALSSFSFSKIYSYDRFLSVLPLAHSYECCLGLIAPVIRGASVTYLDKPPSPTVLLPALKALRPTVMVSVPLLIEKIYNNAIAPKLCKSKLYKFPATRSLAAWFAGRKLLSALGGCIRIFGIGGAPLSPDVEYFLNKAKFPYCIGYGLTEAAPLVAGNSPLRFKLKSGIEAPKNVLLRIVKCLTNGHSNEGEIQVKGPNIMLGYYNDELKTSETITIDGWLRTGDLGHLDKKGKLHIRGRLKALILGPSGENIYPEEIESLLGSSRLIEESLVYSGKKGELVALVRLSEAAKTAAGVIEHTLEDLRTWVNKKLAAFSKLSRIEIKYEPFEKTPTMKIKRYLYL